MKKIFKKFTLAVPVALILSLIFAFSAAATSLVEWESLGDKTISDGVSEYTLFESPYALDIKPDTTFIYENSPFDAYGNLYSYEKYGQIAWLDYGYIFVTDVGRESLLSLEEGDAGAYRIYTGYYEYSDLGDELYGGLLDLDSGALRIDVRELYEYECFEIYGVDSTGTVVMPYGAIYIIDTMVYFLSYLDLPNSCFTADGYFSYLKGEVDVYPTGDSLADELITLVDNATPKYPEYVYEVDYTYEVDEGSAITTFYVIFSLVMLIFPAIFLVVCLALAMSRARRSNRCWLVGVLLSLLWVAASVAILVIIS